MNNDQKILYSEICDGYSFIPKHKIYIKHFSYSEFFRLYSNYESYLTRAQKEGIRTQDAAIKYIIRKKWWDKNRENRITQLSDYIEMRKITLSQMVWDRDKKVIEKDIKDNKAILESYLLERQKLIGLTAEEYAANRINKDAIFEFLFRDEELRVKISEDDNLDITELERQYSKFLIKFDIKNVKRLAATSFFRSLLSLYSDDVSNFFGAPVSKLTKFQTDLLTYSKVFQNKIKSYYSNPDNKTDIPSDILDDPDELIKWAEGNNKVLNKAGGAGGSAVFIDPSEIKKSEFSIIQEAQRNGGSINLTSI